MDAVNPTPLLMGAQQGSCPLVSRDCACCPWLVQGSGDRGGATATGSVWLDGAGVGQRLHGSLSVGRGDLPGLASLL